jgi:F420-non-reducing hydrogenase iron-sulfur subunit
LRGEAFHPVPSTLYPDERSYLVVEEKTYEPTVVAFCCHYCAYSAADLAGSMRIEYSPSVRIIKLMCTGKLDTLHLLKAFEDGADAVFAAG